jgi:putative membrane-bound dehydrogenase-like protein
MILRAIRLPLLVSVSFFCLRSALAAANPSGVGLPAALESMKQFTNADGLEATLFAAEPMLVNPTDIDVDSQGRVWVAEGANYRSSFQRWGILRPEGDRIVILEDTDGDGRADKQTVFYQDPSINAALGVCVLGNKVIVSDSPNVFLLTDTDGDGKADRRELLFTGISGVDHDHGVHAFVFGPDGKLYFNMGNEGKQLRAPVNRTLPLHGLVGKVDSTPVIDLAGNEVKTDGKPYRMGLVFRCNLDGSQLETLAWNFRNNYEVTVDSFGTLWQSDNDDDGNRGVRINYVMPFGNYGYADELTGAGWHVAWEAARQKGAAEKDKVFFEWHQHDPGVVPNLLNTGGGSPTGIAIYEGGLLPPVFRNQIVHCDAGPRVVRSYLSEPSGAGYHAAIKDILTTPNSWFRPSDVCVAPDGALFVADWNDAGVGGHNMADQKLETMTGRIYRIAPPGNPPAQLKVDLSSASGGVQALQSPNLATRYLAWTKLNSQGAAAEKDLAKLWHGKNPRFRARALQLLARIPRRADAYLDAAIKDTDPDIRITGLRIACALNARPLEHVRALVHDPSAQVRRECAIALRHNLNSEAPTLWAELASRHDGQDRWYLEALGIAADKQWDAFLAAWLKQVGANWNTPAGRDLIWRSRSSQTADLVARILSSNDCKAQDRDHYFRSLDFVPAPQRESALISLVETQSKSGAAATLALEALDRLKAQDVAANPRLTESLGRLLDHAAGTPEFVDLVRRFKITHREAGLLEVAQKEPESSAAADAIRMLLASSDGSALLKQELNGKNAVNTAKALGSAEKNDTLPLLAPIVTNSACSPDLRKQAIKSLAEVHQGAALLLDFARHDQLPADSRLTASSSLHMARWDDIRKDAQQLLPLPTAADQHQLPPIPELAKMRGDPANGAAVFHREAVGCVRCHQINGQGIDFGPNLSEIGTKLGKDALYESILDPSAGISFGYEAHQLLLKNGDEPYGIIVSETADELSLKAVNGVISKYKKSDIASRVQQKTSAMPAGLPQTMSTQDLVDLVEYLSRLRKN